MFRPLYICVLVLLECGPVWTLAADADGASGAGGADADTVSSAAGADADADSTSSAAGADADSAYVVYDAYDADADTVSSAAGADADSSSTATGANAAGADADSAYVVYDAYGASSADGAGDNAEPVFRIVNGYPAKLGEVPYQISLRVLASRARYKTFCGGALVAVDRVVSAAHCFQPFLTSAHKNKIGSIYAVAGTLKNTDRYVTEDSAEGGQWRRLRSVLYPAQYSFPNYDICVATTTRNFVLGPYVSAVNLTHAARAWWERGRCLVSGYGRVSVTQKERSDVLLVAELDIEPPRTCERLHRKDMARFLCTATIVSDVAKGDSGGPLVCSETGDPREGPRGVLVGVVSGAAPVTLAAGSARQRQARGPFFTRVAPYAAFLEGRAQRGPDAPSAGSRTGPRGTPALVLPLWLIIQETLLPS